jgi:hypothetical protein
METIQLNEAQVAEAERLGIQTWSKWKSRPGHYGNSLSKHRLGKIGEIGVELWARRTGFSVDPAFRDLDRENEADLVLDAKRVAVKTWSVAWWESMGRCVTPTQLPYLRVDAIIWCYVDGSTVTIAGWSTVEDVARQPIVETGPPHHLVKNHQIPTDEVHPLEALLCR